MIEQLTLLGERDGVATLTGPREVVLAAQNRRADLEAAFYAATGLRLKVELIVPEPTAAPTPVESAPARRSMQEHPLVQQAINELGAVFMREAPRSRPAPQN